MIIAIWSCIQRVIWPLRCSQKSISSCSCDHSSVLPPWHLHLPTKFKCIPLQYWWADSRSATLQYPPISSDIFQYPPMPSNTLQYPPISSNILQYWWTDSPPLCYPECMSSLWTPRQDLLKSTTTPSTTPCSYLSVVPSKREHANEKFLLISECCPSNFEQTVLHFAILPVSNPLFQVSLSSVSSELKS